MYMMDVRHGQFSWNVGVTAFGINMNQEKAKFQAFDCFNSLHHRVREVEELEARVSEVEELKARVSRLEKVVKELVAANVTQQSGNPVRASMSMRSMPGSARCKEAMRFSGAATVKSHVQAPQPPFAPPLSLRTGGPPPRRPPVAPLPSPFQERRVLEQLRTLLLANLMIDGLRRLVSKGSPQLALLPLPSTSVDCLLRLVFFLFFSLLYSPSHEF